MNESIGIDEQNILSAANCECLIIRFSKANILTVLEYVNGWECTLNGSNSTISFQVGFGTTVGTDTLSVTLSEASSSSLSLSSLDIGSGGLTTTAMDTIDRAINSVSSLRGTLGAIQNRLGSTINNLAIQVENLSAAESRIRDVDVAYETAQLTRNSILQQASISILSQANSQPQSALQLLG